MPLFQPARWNATNVSCDPLGKCLTHDDLRLHLPRGNIDLPIEILPRAAPELST